MPIRYREYHYRWEWQLRSTPEALWPFISDTNHFNRDTGLPTLLRPKSDGQPLLNARRRLRFFRFGIPVEWEEEPFEWVYPYRFGVMRRYSRGPVGEMRALAEVTRQPNGSRLVYQAWARPRNPLGWLAIPIQIGVWSARDFDRTFRRYDQVAARSNGKAPAIDIATGAVKITRFEARLKGFEGENIELWSVSH